jgi:hypothetical protein
MKIIHGSLKGLLNEVKDKKVEAVRVAVFMQSDVVPNGIPRYTCWVIVSAPLDWEQWVEWRQVVGRGLAELTEGGANVPAKITALAKERLAEVREKVTAAGLGVRDGVIAHDAESMQGVLD